MWCVRLLSACSWRAADLQVLGHAQRRAASSCPSHEAPPVIVISCRQHCWDFGVELTISAFPPRRAPPRHAMPQCWLPGAA